MLLRAALAQFVPDKKSMIFDMLEAEDWFIQGHFCHCCPNPVPEMAQP
jgi:hypothetical protein